MRVERAAGEGSVDHGGAEEVAVGEGSEGRVVEPLNRPASPDDDTVDCTVPAGAWAALVTDVAWAATPSGLVFDRGAVTGVNRVAAVEATAYPFIAAASWAHICPYSASVAAMAGVFWPKTLVATNVASCARLAATTAGGTVMANAASYAVAAELACAAASSARVAVSVSQVRYGVTAASIDIDDGPNQSALVSSEITAP